MLNKCKIKVNEMYCQILIGICFTALAELNFKIVQNAFFKYGIVVI